MNIDKSLQLALSYYEEGDLLRAETVCREILDVRRDNAAVLHLLGIICYELKDYESAEKYIRESIRLNPGEAFAYFNLANIFRERQQFDEAINHYQKALEIDSNLCDAHFNLGIIFEETGQVAKAIECYGKVLQDNPNDAQAYNNLGVVLRKSGRVGEAIVCHEKALQLDPGNAKVYYNLGLALHERKRFDEAITMYRKAIKLNPNLSDAYKDLGNSLREKGLLDEAITSYEKALQIEPRRSDAYYNLGNVLKEKGRIDEAITKYQSAIQYDPGHVNAYNNLGIAFQDNGQLEEAITCYTKALQIDSKDAVTHWNLSHALLLSGNLEDGWKEYEWRLKVTNFSQPKLPRPPWDGSHISGLTILLQAEQGFGDTIQFIRYAPLVAQRGTKVIVRCQKELTSLLRNVEGVRHTAGYDEQLPESDLYCPLLSLPFIFRTTLESIPARVPYINVNPTLVRKWSDKVPDDGSKLKVGLVWAGREQRSCSLESFLPFSGVRDITFYSLQKGEAAQQAKSLSGGMELIDYTEDVRDFSDTAALIENLDLVISVDTSVAHLAGALGKPIWTLLPFAPDWRWMLNREDSPWYPTMRLFRQSSRDDWEPVIGRICRDLNKYVHGIISRGI